MLGRNRTLKAKSRRKKKENGRFKKIKNGKRVNE
jgi:hypothetical protein